MNFILYPMLINIFGAILTLFFYKYYRLQKYLSLIISIIFLIMGVKLLIEVDQNGIQTLNIGKWLPMYGITYVADRFSSMMVVVTAVMAICCTLYTFGYQFGGARNNKDFKFFTTFFHFMMAGATGAFLTGDLFNLFVTFEILLLASFVLMIMGNKQSQLEGGLKYIMINLISSTIFLVGLGLFYGNVGALNMAEIAVRLSASEENSMVLVVGIMLIITFSIKAALFPFNFWLPSSYHRSHPLISAIFAGLLTKVGIYALLRVFPLIFISQKELFQYVLLTMAGLTMITGAFGAATDYNSRRILSFNIIAQIGYMALGVALFTPLSIAATIFNFIHHIITKTALFVSAGHLNLYFGHDQIKRMGGLYKLTPFASILFLIPALSIAGIPPFSGFFGKFFVLQATFQAENWILLICGVFVGFLTLYSMIKIWTEAYWKERNPEEEEKFPMRPGIPVGPLLSAIFLTLSVILIGIFAGPLYEFSTKAAADIIDPQVYIQAVLGKK